MSGANSKRGGASSKRSGAAGELSTPKSFIDEWSPPPVYVAEAMLKPKPAVVYSLPKKAVAEALGTLVLLITIIGSGIMAESLAQGNTAVALLANTIATGAMLAVLVKTLIPVSGAHFNPVVTLAFLLKKEISLRNAFVGVVTLAFLLKKEISVLNAFVYVVTQLVAGFVGVVGAHLMFDEPTMDISSAERNGVGVWLGEFIATFGLMATIISLNKTDPGHIPYCIGLYITAAAWFTSSNCFANPAVTVARMFTHTGAGIRPIDVPLFVVFQILGGLCGTGILSWMFHVPSPAIDKLSAAFSRSCRPKASGDFAYDTLDKSKSKSKSVEKNAEPNGDPDRYLVASRGPAPAVCKHAKYGTDGKSAEPNGDPDRYLVASRAPAPAVCKHAKYDTDGSDDNKGNPQSMTGSHKRSRSHGNHNRSRRTGKQSSLEDEVADVKSRHLYTV